MKNNKLYTLLISLGVGEDDIKDFANYIKPNPTLRKRQMASLFRFLRPYLSNPDELHKLSKEQVFQSVWPKEPFDARKSRDIATELAKEIRNFYMLKELEDRPDLQAELLTDAYKKRKLDENFLKLAKKSLNTPLDEEAAQYLALSLQNDRLFYHPKANLHQEEEYQKFLDDGFHNLELYYTIKRLKYSCEVLVQRAGYGKDVQPNFEEELRKYLHSLPESNIPLIQLFYEAASFLLDPCVEGYANFKNNFIENIEKLHSDKNSLLRYLTNGLSLINFSGGRLREYFSLYKLGVEHDLLVESGYISATMFNNVVYVACELEDYDWAEGFIEKHVPFLSYNNKLLANIKLLYTCYLLFGRGNYQEVLRKLKDVNYDDFTYAFRKYILELKSIYELHKHNGYTDIEDISVPFKAYVYRKFKAKHISEESRERNENFIYLLKKIAKYPYERTTKQGLLDTLESLGDHLVEKKWLRRKIEEIRGN